MYQGRLTDKHKSANKDELLEMIRFGAEKVIKTGSVENDDFGLVHVRASVCACVCASVCVCV